MKELKKKIAIISAIALLSACTCVAFADETAENTSLETTVITTAQENETAPTEESDAEDADETIEVTEETADSETAESTEDNVENETADEEKTEETEETAGEIDAEKVEESISSLTAEQIDQLICALGTFNGIKVVYNDKEIEFDVQPQIINNRTMVPLRAIFEAIGATVDWAEETRTVTAEKNSVKLSLTIDSDEMIKNDEKIKLDVAPVIVEDRTLVPVRAICEGFGNTIAFDAENLTVVISDIAEIIDKTDVPKELTEETEKSEETTETEETVEAEETENTAE